MLQVKKLSKSFGDQAVLKNISLTIDKGERLVIIGPSGSGKSTFLRCLNGLETPTSGTILFEGTPLDRKHLRPIRQKIGMVFQSFNLFENLSVLDNITLAPVEAKFLTKEEAMKKGLELLKKINLEDKCFAYPSNLSGGQKQRVAIVRALMMDPDIMLFDEPTSALDPEMIGEVLELMRQVAMDGMTMVIVTHELTFAEAIATKVLFMDEGRIKEKGPPEELFTQPKTKRLQEFLSKIK